MCADVCPPSAIFINTGSAPARKKLFRTSSGYVATMYGDNARKLTHTIQPLIPFSSRRATTIGDAHS